MNPPIDSNATVMFPGPESSKDIGKIVHVASLQFHEATRITLCAKKTK